MQRLLLLLVALVLLLGGSASAQDAAAAFARGKAAFEALDFEAARRALEAALAAGGEPLGTELRAEANTLLASLAEARRDLPEAIRRRAAAVEAWTKAKGEGAAELVRPLLDHGRVLRRGGRGREALPVLRRALEIFDAQEKGEPVLSRSIVFELARVADAAGDRAAALAAYRRYLKELEAAVGADASELAYPVGQIARLLGALGRTEEALSTQRRWIALYEKARGKDTPTICRGLERTSAWALDLGRHEEALRDVERWLAILRGVTADHPEIERAERRAARIERERKRPAEALKRLDVALALVAKVRGPRSLAAAGTQKERAAVLRELGRQEEAEVAIDAALAILETKRSERDIEVLDAVLERARIDQARGRGQEAERDLRRVLRAFEDLAGPEHPVLVEPLRLLADIRSGSPEGASEAASLRARAAKIEGRKED